MRFEMIRDFDWQLFWLMQVVFLGVPPLVTVMASGSLSLNKAVVLAFVLIGLTALNVTICLVRAGHGDRVRKH